MPFLVNCIWLSVLSRSKLKWSNHHLNQNLYVPNVMEENDIETTALDRALKRRFSLLEKTRIHRFDIYINLNLLVYLFSIKDAGRAVVSRRFYLSRNRLLITRYVLALRQVLERAGKKWLLQIMWFVHTRVNCKLADEGKEGYKRQELFKNLVDIINIQMISSCECDFSYEWNCNINCAGFRIAERCFQSDEPPVRERRFIVKGLGDTERPVNIVKKVCKTAEL